MMTHMADMLLKMAAVKLMLTTFQVFLSKLLLRAKARTYVP
jgi:hypothetical protein